MQQQDATLIYEFDLKSGTSKEREDLHQGGEITGYICPDCHQYLPEQLTAEIDSTLNG